MSSNIFPYNDSLNSFSMSYYFERLYWDRFSYSQFRVQTEFILEEIKQNQEQLKHVLLAVKILMIFLITTKIVLKNNKVCI